MTGRNLGACLLVFAFVSSALAQEKTEKAPDTPNAELLRRLLEKVDQLDRDLKTVLKNAPKALPENPADRKLVALLDTPVIQSFQLGVRNNQPVEQRVFVAKLTLLNLTPDAKSATTRVISSISAGGPANILSRRPAGPTGIFSPWPVKGSVSIWAAPSRKRSGKKKLLPSRGSRSGSTAAHRLLISRSR